MGAPLIDYLGKVALCLASAYLFYHWLLRNEVNFLGNRLFLLSMLPLSFLLPLAPLRSPFRTLTIYSVGIPETTTIGESTVPSGLTPAFAIALLYLAGVVLFALRILFHLFHLYRLQRSRPRERRGHFVLVRVESPIPPFSFFNRIFLHLPKNHNAGEIEQIISHESVHIRQLHSLDILIMELAVALQWFNPAVWFYRKALKETHEYLADREVIAQGFNADGYRLLLFEQQFGAKLFEFASHLKQSQIKRRMFMMNRMNRAGKVPLKILLALPLIAFLALALAQPKLVLAKAAAIGVPDDVVQKGDQPAKSDQELKERLLKLEQQAKLLEEKLNSVGSAEERKKLEQALEDVFKKRQVLMTEHGLTPKMKTLHPDEEKLKELLVKFEEKEKSLKEQYGQADDPEKKKEIGKQLDMLYKGRQELLTGAGMKHMKWTPSLEEMQKKLLAVHEYRLKLEQLIAGEKNPERAKELKLKFDDLGKLEEELKIGIEKSSSK